jgi:hypothetical protein
MLWRKQTKVDRNLAKLYLYSCIDFMETFTLPSVQMWRELNAHLNLLPIVRKRGAILPYRHVFLLIDAVFN